MAANEKQKKSSLRYMIMSLIIAIAIWALISYSNDPDISKTFHNIKVSFTGEEQLKKNGYVVIHTDDIPDLSAKISGKRDDLIRAIGNIRLSVDVSDINSAGGYDLSGTLALPSHKLSVEKQNFSTVPVVIDEYISKEIPVEVRKTGSSEYLVESVPAHETIVINGAKSELVNVKSAFVSIDDSEITESGEVSRPLSLADGDGESVKRPESADMDDHIVVKNTLYNTVTVPVTLKLSAELAGQAELDETASSISPTSVSIGVLPETEISHVTAVITEITDGELECRIETPPGAYIPEKLRRVKVKAVYKNTEN